MYAYLRGWLERFEDRQEDGVGIGGIHPYALRAKLAEEREVQWRLGVPVLLGLIEREVQRGRRAFVVCGLGAGDWEWVRAFADKVSFVVVWRFEARVGELTRLQIAEPNGVLAFLPVVDAGGVVPPEFESRTVEVSGSLRCWLRANTGADNRSCTNSLNRLIRLRSTTLS